MLKSEIDKLEKLTEAFYIPYDTKKRYLKLIAYVRKLEAKTELAKERLGPAGYRMLDEVKAYRALKECQEGENEII